MLVNPAVRLASALNPANMNLNMPRNILGAAGDRLRDMIVPEALASAITVPGFPSMGLLWGGDNVPRDMTILERDGEVAEKYIDDLLSASCPLCEGVVVGLDRPFVALGEDEDSWQL